MCVVCECVYVSVCECVYVSVCVCVSVCWLGYPARKAHAQYYTAICGLSRSTILPHIISQAVQFAEKSYRTQNVRFDCLYNFHLRHFSF
jgi:hypothetical protein